MSFSRSGPKRSDILAAVVGGKGLENRSGLEAPDSADALGSDDSPAELPWQQRLLQHEQARLAALDDDRKLADNALRDVIGDLDLLLASTATEVRASATGRRTKKQVKKAVPQLVAIDERGELPLTEVAELLDLSQDDVDGVLAGLAARGELTNAERTQALGQIEQLRTKLQEVEVNRNHSQLAGLLPFILEVGLLVKVASTPFGAQTDEDAVLAEAIKTGILALVGLALQKVVDRNPDPQGVAEQAREDLLKELTLGRNLTKQPAYEGEHVVLRFRLQVRCVSARVTSLPNPQYWQLLDQIALALDHDAPKTLILIHRKLEATPL